MRCGPTALVCEACGVLCIRGGAHNQLDRRVARHTCAVRLAARLRAQAQRADRAASVMAGDGCKLLGVGSVRVRGVGQMHAPAVLHERVRILGHRQMQSIVRMESRSPFVAYRL